MRTADIARAMGIHSRDVDRLASKIAATDPGWNDCTALDFIGREVQAGGRILVIGWSDTPTLRTVDGRIY